MYELIKTLYPIYRSITGQGVRDSLSIIADAMGGGDLHIKSIKSGTQVYDWTIPPEYNVKDAYIITPNGQKICEFKKHNLHLLCYSEPVRAKLCLDELKNHLYTDPRNPSVIPYVTSYYERRWGFCLSQNDFNNLQDGEYEVFIDSEFNENGELNYMDAILPATIPTKDEILISTYICHPQMANNELSGPAVFVEIYKWLKAQKERKYNYRFVIAPEAIGAIAYISQNFDNLKQNCKGGFVLSCLGDNGDYSVVLPPDECSLSARAALMAGKDFANFKSYPFLMRGSDERQYNTPALNLCVVALCRSKFGAYKEYHSSADDLTCVSIQGLKGGFEWVKACIKAVELNDVYKLQTICEPFLGKYNLTPTISQSGRNKNIYLPRHFLAYCDGQKDILDIAKILDTSPSKLEWLIKACLENKLIKSIK